MVRISAKKPCPDPEIFIIISNHNLAGLRRVSTKIRRADNQWKSCSFFPYIFVMVTVKIHLTGDPADFYGFL